MTAHAGPSSSPASLAGPVHMLSFDVEEYFQVEAAAAGLSPRQWDSFELRLAPAVEKILQLLSDHGATATFFVLGWVARRDADLVRRIARAGHEIASHGMTHKMITRLSPDQFRGELLDSKKLLEDITAQPVVGFRAATFSVTRATAWALDILAETPYVYDSSVFPVRHDRYGVPDAPTCAHHAVGPGGGRILEIPPLTLRCLGRNWPVGGGGYLRLLPVRVVAAALQKAQQQGRSGMIYLHPWELDPDQPALPMGRAARWRHRVNLKRTEKKLRRLLRRFKFVEVRKWLEQRPADEQMQTFHYDQLR